MEIKELFRKFAEDKGFAAKYQAFDSLDVVVNLMSSSLLKALCLPCRPRVF